MVVVVVEVEVVVVVVVVVVESVVRATVGAILNTGRGKEA